MRLPARSWLTIALLSEVLLAITIATPNTNVTSVLCNSGEYTAGDPFAISLAYVLADLIDSTPASKGWDYYNISPFPNAFAYGHAACNGSLTDADCTACLRAAEMQMNSTCGRRIALPASELQRCR